jgi:hypothetical protein
MIIGITIYPYYYLKRALKRGMLELSGFEKLQFQRFFMPVH